MTGILTISAALSGCGQKKESTAELDFQKSDDTLTVYLWDTDLLTGFTPYLHEQLPDKNIEIIAGCNNTDLYSYLNEHGELPDIITVRRFSGTDAKDLQPYLMDFSSYDVVSKYSSYALQYYKSENGDINWLPVCGIPQTIIANKTLFDKYGIGLPTNYEEYKAVCRAFHEVGIKPYAIDLANDWSAHELIQAGGIGELTSLEGIKWRNEAESAQGDIAFDADLWKPIFGSTISLLEDSYLTADDLAYDIEEAMELFVNEKAAMFHGNPVNMNQCQELMDAELVRIPYFSQTSDEGFIYMNPSLNIAFNKELENNPDKLDTAMRVLECMISEEGQKKIANGSSVISFNPEVASSSDGMTGLETQIENNEYYIRYSAQKSFEASLKTVQELLTGSLDVNQAYETFSSIMNSKNEASEAAVNFENEYSIKLNDKNGRDAASCILNTVREKNGVQLAFAPYYSFSSSIYKGECTEKRVKMMVAYTPAIYLTRVGGAQLKAMVQEYLAGNDGDFCPASAYELPVASGMKLIVHKKADGFELKDILIDGSPLEDETEYSIMIVGEAVSALKKAAPEKKLEPMESENFSSSWTNAVVNKYQIPGPEDYIEIAG